MGILHGDDTSGSSPTPVWSEADKQWFLGSPGIALEPVQDSGAVQGPGWTNN